MLGFQIVADQSDGQARLSQLDGVVGQVEIPTFSGAAFNDQVTPGANLSAVTERDWITLHVKGPVQRNMGTSCSNYSHNGQRVEAIKIDGVRYKAEDLPKIVVTGPSSMGLRIKRSLVRGQAGDVGGATITMIGCGDFSLGKVARNLELIVAGSGDCRTQSVGGGLHASLANPRDYQTGPVKGNLKLDLAGSGDTFIQAGRSRLEANIAGSGTIRHGGTVVDPQINIIGSGNVSIAKLKGSSRVTKLGSGGFKVYWFLGKQITR